MKGYKFRVLSVDHFHDYDSSSVYNNGAIYDLEEALRICKEWGDEKGMNGMVSHTECLVPVREKDLKIERLRDIGCTCPQPLVGYAGKSTKLRCRICNKREE